MKVIDLLNKIANGDRPNFRFKGNEYIYDKFDRSYKPSFLGMFKIYAILNDGVEIIEEPQEHKIPEKLNTWYGIKPVNLDSPSTFKDNAKYIDYNTEMFFDKINEILDYLEVNNDRKR